MFSWTAFRAAVSLAAASALVDAPLAVPPAAGPRPRQSRRVRRRPSVVAVKTAVNRGAVRISQLSA